MGLDLIDDCWKFWRVERMEMGNANGWHFLLLQYSCSDWLSAYLEVGFGFLVLHLRSTVVLQQFPLLWGPVCIVCPDCCSDRLSPL